MVDRVEAADEADIAVENVLIVIVLDLHHLVAQAEDLPVKRLLGFHRAGGIEGRLQLLIQGVHSGRAAVHGRQHLHLAERVEAEALGDALADDILHPLCGFLGRLGGEEEEIGGFLGEERHFPLVDAVGVGDDVRPGCLAEDDAQARHRGDTAGDHIPQHVACPHRGELVYVAHQQQVGARLEGFEQAVGQQQVEHGGLIHHQQVDRQGVLRVIA